MNNKELPADRRPVLFTDLSGTSHTGFYNESIRAFIESAEEERPEAAGKTFLADEISAWEYLESNKNPDSDYMVIF